MRRSILPLAFSIAWLQLTAPAAARRAEQRAAPPAPSTPITLTVSVGGRGMPFRPGEPLPIELQFDSRIPTRFVVDGATYDHSGRLTVDTFRIEPEDGVSDPLLDYFGSGDGFIGGGIRSMGVLGGQPFTVKVDLNEWARFDRAGTYTLSVLSRRVTDETSATGTESTVPVQSNRVSFEILPRDPGWEDVQITGALELLDSTRPDVDRRKGCRTLRFLATDRAVDELITHFDDERWGCGFDAVAALFTARDRDRVVRRMEAGLRAEDQPISVSYLYTLAGLSVYAQHPELRPRRTRDSTVAARPAAELTLLRELIAAATASYTATLDTVLPDKTPRARVLILAGRLNLGRPEPAAPATSAALRDRLRTELAATFATLPAERRISLLDYDWRSIAGPAMLPALRALVETPAPAWSSLHDLALRRMYELAPDEARPRLLSEIRSPSPGATLKTLTVLPDRELRELDNLLAGNVESREGDLALHAELLQRYASAAISARVWSRTQDWIGRLACRPQAALLAYFLRAAPQIGQSLLDHALESRGVTGCYLSVLREVATLHMAPGLEAAAVAHLEDPDPQVVASAAETLERHGSPSSVQPLRARFERWRREWEGREQELRPSDAEPPTNAYPAVVELQLLTALARGQAWLTSEAELRHLQALCVTDNCRRHADPMIAAAADTTITILHVDGPANSSISLAQYQMASISELERKLTQYPTGSSFALDVSTLDPQTARGVSSELASFAEAHGISLRR